MYDPFESPGYPLGNASKDVLKEVHPKLRLIAFTLISFQNVAIREGHRNEEEQTRAFNQGLSKLAYPKSKHNVWPSRAIHFLPYPVSWENSWKNLARYYFLAGRVMQIADSLGIRLRWGGDWDHDLDFSDQHFDDLAHYELLDTE